MKLRPLHIALIVAPLLIVGSLAYWLGDRHMSWEEEVQLPDGRVVKVAQSRVVGKFDGIKRARLTVNLPELGGERTWKGQAGPALLGVADGKVYIVARVMTPIQNTVYSNPRYGYAAFVWDGSLFSRIGFLSVPASLRVEENVRWCAPLVSEVTLTRQDKWHNTCTNEDGTTAQRVIDLARSESEAKQRADVARVQLGAP